MLFKNKNLKELLISEFDEFHSKENSFYNQNLKKYGKNENGIELKIPKGYKLLPLGHEIPHKHMYYTKTSSGNYIWKGPTNTISTMTPIFAMISGWTVAFAVPIDN